MFVFSNAQNLTNHAFHHHLCSFGLLGITFVQVELHLNALCVSLPVDAVLWRITKAPAAASGCWDRKQRDKVSLGTLGILPPGDRYCETLCGTTPLICTVCKRMNIFQTSAWFFLLQNTRWDNLQPRQSCLYKSTAASSGSCHLVAKLVRYPPCPDWAWPILDTQHSFSWIVCIEIFSILYHFVLYCIILQYIKLYCAVFYYGISYYAILSYYISYHILLCYIILCYIILYHIILYHIILYYITVRVCVCTYPCLYYLTAGPRLIQWKCSLFTWDMPSTQPNWAKLWPWWDSASSHCPTLAT